MNPPSVSCLNECCSDLPKLHLLSNQEETMAAENRSCADTLGPPSELRDRSKKRRAAGHAGP